MTNEEAIKYLKQLYPNGGHCWLDKQRIEAIGMAVKALQEEPAPKIFEDMLNAKTAAESLGISQEEHDRIIDECIYGKEPELVDTDDLPKEEPVSDIDFEQELYKAFGQVKDFTLGMRIAKWFYDMGKKNQEPVSEELGEYISELSKQFQEVSFAKLSRIAVRVAKWQEEKDNEEKVLIYKHGFYDCKEQFEKNRLAHCDAQTEEEAEIEQDFVMGIIENEHRQPTFDDAIKYGMKLQKKQMIKDAYEREVKIDAGGYPYIPQMELYDYDKDEPLAKEGDRVKVVVIKEG